MKNEPQGSGQSLLQPLTYRTHHFFAKTVLSAKRQMSTSKRRAGGNAAVLKKKHRTDVSGGRETGLFTGKTPSCSKRPR